MPLYRVEIEIPTGEHCNECCLLDNEHQYCHLFEEEILKYDYNKNDVLKCDKCPAKEIKK